MIFFISCVDECYNTQHPLWQLTLQHIFSIYEKGKKKAHNSKKKKILKKNVPR